MTKWWRIRVLGVYFPRYVPGTFGSQVRLYINCTKASYIGQNLIYTFLPEHLELNPDWSKVTLGPQIGQRYPGGVLKATVELAFLQSGGGCYGANTRYTRNCQ